jgi:hypothetical protein
MVTWRPDPDHRILSQVHRDALPRFLTLVGILVACGVFLILA